MQPQRYKLSSCGGRGQISAAGPQFTVVFMQESLSFPSDRTDPPHAALPLLMCRKGEGPSLQRNPGDFTSKTKSPTCKHDRLPRDCFCSAPRLPEGTAGGSLATSGYNWGTRVLFLVPCRDTTWGRSRTGPELSIWGVVRLEA